MEHSTMRSHWPRHKSWPWLARRYRPYIWIILSMASANERRRYIVTSPLIGWAHTQNDPWYTILNNDLILHPREIYNVVAALTPHAWLGQSGAL